MGFAIIKRTVMYFPIIIIKSTFAIYLIVPKFSNIFISILKNKYSLSIFPTILEFTFIPIFLALINCIRVFKDSSIKFSFIHNIFVRNFQLSKSIRLTLIKLASKSNILFVNSPYN